ncbi:MAG: hypothetical protein L0G94_19285 [Brachybacterium sp.]|uniref:hypothetical protein n=1 Tax=Brachybacterium sp. TaxID=1891286 RepID=UPI002647EDDA|nr:hypothetical protein [Brachybacterium sp.]MDN5688800.1 hypothetical protein [Brachybacterium sp.]
MMKTIRRADVGLAGNGGRFAPTARGDVAIDVPPAPPQAPGRELALDPEINGLAASLESSFDESGRTVVAIGIDRDQLATSDYRVGSAPWELEDEEVTDDQVDAYLESRSDDPEAFGDNLGFDGQVRWNSAASTLELTHTGYEGVSDNAMSAQISDTLRDFRDDLHLHEWR